MNKSALFVALIAMSVADVAKADFAFSVTVQDAGGGLQRVQVFARSTGSGVDVGSKALGSDITITDFSGHNLVTKFVSGAATAKADLTGIAAPDPYNSDRSFVNLLGDPSGGPAGTDNDPTAYNVVQTVPMNTHSNYLNGVSQFEVVGANLSGGVDATSAANGGKGALIAVAVAPLGDIICFNGAIGGNQPGSPPQEFLSTCPEPSSIVVLAAALAAPVLRRTRAQRR